MTDPLPPLFPMIRDALRAAGAADAAQAAPGQALGLDSLMMALVALELQRGIGRALPAQRVDTTSFATIAAIAALVHSLREA